MKPRSLVLAFMGLAAAVMITLVTLWGSGGLAGTPNLPISDSLGTSKVVSASPSEVAAAVTNAFDLFRYHGMMLTDPVGEDWMAPSWHPTNGYLLIPTGDFLTRIPTKGLLGSRQLPYIASFHITLAPQASNQTQVNVRTVSAKVLDGITLGHGGTVANTASVRPIRQEEEKVINAILKQLGLHEESFHALTNR